MSKNRCLHRIEIKIFEQINTDKISFDTLDKFGYYESGSSVGKAEVLFQRIDTKKSLSNAQGFFLIIILSSIESNSINSQLSGI